ncbi:hypothetical protein CFP56_028469 [Quercus suber]|uniref:Uncharacterized protein n=1 Tax=Quercus suber TaxID=58331 RepID=A0AAW0JU06_QUESU
MTVSYIGFVSDVKFEEEMLCRHAFEVSDL